MEKRQRGGVSSLQDALSEFMQASGLGRHLEIFPIFQAWNDSVGPDLAAIARPVRFQRGELTIEVASSAHMHELQGFTGEGYRVMANQKLADTTPRKPIIHRLSFKLKR